MRRKTFALKRANRTIALVPTMGYLHEGHLSLIRAGRAEADELVVSIFVNPTQFGQNEDLDRYPRDFERDEALCRQEKVDVVFYPSVSEMYAPDHSVYVTEDSLARGLCGASRPGHFRGVLTIVAKLFNLTLPDVAVFGEKDAQQLRIIERMVRDLDFPVRILRHPTVREADGLAMSSRNVNLSPDERRQALCLHASLELARRMYESGERRAGVIRDAMAELILANPSARIDYVQFVDDCTLQPVDELERPCLVAHAVFVGNTRLIDNVVLGSE